MCSRSFLLFLSAILEAFCCFCRPSWKLFAVFVGHLGSFSLLLLAILEAFRCYCWPSWKLFAVIVGHLGSFSLLLLAILEAFCCFCWPSWKLFAVICWPCRKLLVWLVVFVFLVLAGHSSHIVVCYSRSYSCHPFSSRTKIPLTS